MRFCKEFSVCIEAEGDWWGDWKKGGAGVDEAEAKQLSIQLEVVHR